MPKHYFLTIFEIREVCDFATVKGEIIRQDKYDYVNTRPRLRQDDSGNISVYGGIRRTDGRTNTCQIRSRIRGHQGGRESSGKEGARQDI